jgi:hypothetical protein
MVLVLITTLTNCRFVLVVVIGFVLCVCTLGLNWFGYNPSVHAVPPAPALVTRYR